MATGIVHHNGIQDFQLNSIINAKVHIYGTLASMNADVATSASRIVYCLEDSKFYFGSGGTWVPSSFSGSFSTTPVATPADLPVAPPAGQVTVVLADPGNGGIPAVWLYDGTSWKSLSAEDSRFVITSGAHKFTGIPGVSNSGTVVPVANADLTHKLYVDTGDAAVAATDATARTTLHGTITGETTAAISAARTVHLNETNAMPGGSPDPHPEYTKAAAVTTLANAAALAAVNTHLTDINVAPGGGADPHPEYTKPAAATTIANTAVSAHNVSGPAHSGQQWQNLGQVNGLISGHNTDDQAHGGIVEQLKDILQGNETKVNAFTDDFAYVASSIQYGQPVTRNGVSGIYIPATAGYQVAGLATRQSTQTTVLTGVVGVVFASTGITMPGGTVMTSFIVGQVLLFPGSALNINQFKIRSIVGLVLKVDQAPVAETVTTDVVRAEKNGQVTFSGVISVPELLSKLASTSINTVLVNYDSLGRARITLSGTPNLSGILPGDVAVIAGTLGAGNDGSYIVDDIVAGTVVLSPLTTNYNLSLAVTSTVASTKTVNFGGGPDLSAAVTALGLGTPMSLKIAGSTGGVNDRVFTVISIDNTAKSLVVSETLIDDVTGSGTVFSSYSSQLTGTDMAGPGPGTLIVNSSTQAHDFKDATFYNALAISYPIAFYYDAVAAHKYSVTVGTTLLGYQLSRYVFFVSVQQISSGGTPAFSAILSGTNSNALLVSGTLGATGGGVLTANALAANTSGANLAAGTVPNSALQVAVTLQGNAFNGNSQLVQLTGAGKYPALDGSLITNLPAGAPAFSAITSATNTTAAMLVGTGSSLGPTGSGTVTANALSVNSTGQNVTLGVANATSGTVVLNSGTSAFGVTLQQTGATANQIYSWPNTVAAVTGYPLTSSTAGVMRWSPNIVLRPVNGTQNLIGVATTADALADTLIAASATTQKCLVLQGKASQAYNAPCLQIQTSTGVSTFEIVVSNSVVTGSGNHISGFSSTNILTSGGNNAIYGSNSGQSLTTGSRNSWLGTNSGNSSGNSTDTVCVGMSCGVGTRGVSIGSQAGGTVANANDLDNVFIGYVAGNVATGSAVGRNVYIGSGSGQLATTSQGNTCVGYNSGGSVLTTGNNNILLGNNTTVSTAAGSNNFVAGSGAAPMNNIYFGNGMTNAAPNAYTINGTTATAPVNGSTAGAGFNLQGGNAAASAGTAGAAAGGGLAFVGGNAAQQISGNADAGHWTYTAGAAVGTGNTSGFRIPRAATSGASPQAAGAAISGQCVLVAGTMVVNTTAVTANSTIVCVCKTPGGTIGILTVPTIVNATSFTIQSDLTAGTIQVLDTSTVYWMLVN